MTVEVWRPVETDRPSRVSYEVSNLGRIRSTDRKGVVRVLKAVSPSPNSGRTYPWVKIAGRQRLVHVLVAKAFLPPPADADMVVMHADGDPTNPAAANLRWGTRTENQIEALRHRPRKVLTEAEVVQIRALKRRHKFSNLKLAALFGISPRHVRNILNYKTWGHLP